MLQQTRVSVVEPRFRSFIERFPTVEALADADLESVLSAWSGLGYYRRARHLHAAAREIARRGGFPSSLAGLRELPGVGDYTAAAVGSIAFGWLEPALDGNVMRVTARWLALDGSPTRAAVREQLRGAAAAFLDRERPGDSNQALMELGATVCTPRAPRCGDCPLRRSCRARELGEPERYPPPRRRRALERHALIAAVVVREDRCLLVRRDEDAELLAGTWEIPWVRADRAQASDALAAHYGGEFELHERCGILRHTITFRELVVEVVRARLTAPPTGEGERARWFAAHELAHVPHSSLVAKILRCAGELDAGAAAGGEDVPADQLVVDFAQPLGDQRGEDLEQA
jgi:A/G-specific adenine glycosylase